MGGGCVSSPAGLAAVPGWLTVPAWLQAVLGLSRYAVHTCNSLTGRQPSRVAAAYQIQPSSAGMPGDMAGWKLPSTSDKACFSQQQPKAARCSEPRHCSNAAHIGPKACTQAAQGSNPRHCSQRFWEAATSASKSRQMMYWQLTAHLSCSLRQ